MVNSPTYCLTRTLLFISLALLVGGCATGRYSVPVTDSTYRPIDNKALVIFMRHSFVGSAISSSLFDISDGDEQLIAILKSKNKVAYYSPPGQRQFMVIAENADFMDANLQAGKIYYAIVTPRMGIWKARFSIHPFKRVAGEPEFQLDSPQLIDWLNKCDLVEANDEAIAWALAHAESIRDKKVKYLQKWDVMLEKDKRWRRLDPHDGLDSPVD